MRPNGAAAGALSIRTVKVGKAKPTHLRDATIQSGASPYTVFRAYPAEPDGIPFDIYLLHAGVDQIRAAIREQDG